MVLLADLLLHVDPWLDPSLEAHLPDPVFYTTEVINTPSRIASDLVRARKGVAGIALQPMEQEATAVQEAIRIRDEARRREILDKLGCSPCDQPAVDPVYFQTYQTYRARKKEVVDPTSPIVVDEADRLQMNSPEQMRSLFDRGGIGMVLINTPGIEKSVARFAQFCSNIGVVHEFRPLSPDEMQALLEQHWRPLGVSLPESTFAPRVVAKLIRITSGNLRLLTRLLTQIQPVLSAK